MKTLFAFSTFLVFALQAQGVSVMDFRSGGTNSGYEYGNVRTFSKHGVTAVVTAWAETGSSWIPAYLGQSSAYGLSNKNGSLDNSFAIDNQGYIDYVQFKFDRPVELEGIYLDVFGSDGDFEYWTDPGAMRPWDTGAPGSGGIGVSHESSGWASLSGITDYLLIGAEHSNDRVGRTDRDDRFKIRKFAFSRPSGPANSVPEGGATLGMLGIALLGLAGLKRMKSRR